jgi:predicted branched-subunit amino acid permease
MQVFGGETSSGARAVAPLAVAVAALGVPFGALATAAGLSPLAAVIMSATTFAGSAQFAAVSILGSGGSVAAAVGTAALLNARYTVMGIAIASALPGGVWQRMLFGQLAVDESWAVAWRDGGRFSPERLLGSGLVLYVTHVSSTAIGTVAGNLLADPSQWGLDAAFPALFVVLLWPHLRQHAGLVAAVTGGAIALALTPHTPPGVPTLAAAAASFTGWRLR